MWPSASSSTSFRNGVQLDSLCGCGEPFSQCPFWTAVGDRAFGGWSGFDVEPALALQAKVDRSTAIPLLVSPVAARGPLALRSRTTPRSWAGCTPR